MKVMGPVAVNPRSSNTSPPPLIPSAFRASPSLPELVSLAPLQLSWPPMSAPVSRTVPAAVNPWLRITSPPTLIPMAYKASLWAPELVNLAPLQSSRPPMSAPARNSVPAAVNPWLAVVDHHPQLRNPSPPTLILSAFRALFSLPGLVNFAPVQMSTPAMSASASATDPAAVNPSSRNTCAALIPWAFRASPPLPELVSLAPLQLSWPPMSAPDNETVPAAVNPPSRNTLPPTLIPSAIMASLSVPELVS